MVSTCAGSAETKLWGCEMNSFILEVLKKVCVLNYTKHDETNYKRPDLLENMSWVIIAFETRCIFKSTPSGNMADTQLQLVVSLTTCGLLVLTLSVVYTVMCLYLHLNRY